VSGGSYAQTLWNVLLHRACRCCIAAVMEYLAAGVLELAANAACDKK
jgi:hypothetical protein